MKKLALLLCAAAVAVGLLLIYSHGFRVTLSHLPALGWLESDSTDHRHVVQEMPPEKSAVKHVIPLDAAQIKSVGIVTVRVGPATVARHKAVFGAIVVNGDKVARVAVKIVGTVAELRKGLGDAVEKGDVLGVLESREVADAKSDYLTFKLTYELQQTLAARAKTLVDVKAMSENEFLRSRLTADDALVKFEGARQKLYALGLGQEQIETLPTQTASDFRLQEIRAPISGRVVERRVETGALVGREGQESELFVIANLDEVWVELSVNPNDLVHVSESSSIAVRMAGQEPASATIRFISPLLDRDTRMARVVAVLKNPQGLFRPGAYVSADIPLERKQAAMAVPEGSVQLIDAKPVVFVRVTDGFEARPVSVGLSDGTSSEIISGLEAGEEVAAANSFVLKAELGKHDAGDEH